MADRYLTTKSGIEETVEFTTASTGAGNAGDGIALDTTGKIDTTLLPTGAGPDDLMMIASEALTAGAYVNIVNELDGIRIRNADNSNQREAHGFILAAVANGGTAHVFFRGQNTSAPTGVPGQKAFLGIAGGVLADTGLDEMVAANIGKINQFLGTYVGVNNITTEIDAEVIIV